MTLRLITDASTEPITLDRVRRHLRIDDDNTVQDADILDMITGARRLAEFETGRNLTTQTWEQVLDAFPSSEIELGHPSVIEVVSILYIDSDSMQQTLDSAAYVLDRDTDPGYVMPAAGTSWPATFADSTNAVRIRFTTGYLADEDKDRSGLRSWMLVQIGTDWKFRESLHTGPITELPNRHTDRKLDPYRWYG